MKAEPPPLRPDEEYTYVILLAGLGSTFNYVTEVYYQGRRIARSYTDTLWGARRAARREKRDHQAMLDPDDPNLLERGTL